VDQLSSDKVVIINDKIDNEPDKTKKVNKDVCTSDDQVATKKKKKDKSLPTLDANGDIDGASDNKEKKDSKYKDVEESEYGIEQIKKKTKKKPKEVLENGQDNGQKKNKKKEKTDTPQLESKQSTDNQDDTDNESAPEHFQEKDKKKAKKKDELKDDTVDNQQDNEHTKTKKKKKLATNIDNIDEDKKKIRQG